MEDKRPSPYKGPFGFHMQKVPIGGVEPPSPDRCPHRRGRLPRQYTKLRCVRSAHLFPLLLPFILPVSVVTAKARQSRAVYVLLAGVRCSVTP